MTAHAPRTPITDRERAVLEKVAQGLTYQQTAEALGISANTVRVHIRSLYGKLGVRSKAAAALAAIRARLIQP